jgi:hypothetical protein
MKQRKKYKHQLKTYNQEKLEQTVAIEKEEDEQKILSRKLDMDPIFSFKGLYQPLIYGEMDEVWYQAHIIEEPQSNTVIFFKVIRTNEVMRQVDIIPMGHSLET